MDFIGGIILIGLGVFIIYQVYSLIQDINHKKEVKKQNEERKRAEEEKTNTIREDSASNDN
jgi:putative Mn2+ efflux pump MntP